MTFRHWRRIHLVSSGVAGGVALIHSALTPVLYGSWSPNAVWFLGTGLGLLLLAVSNWSHVGCEPCHQPTAPVVRWANFVFLALGLGALIAVPQPQAFLLVVALAGQAIAGCFTLRGPKGIADS